MLMDQTFRLVCSISPASIFAARTSSSLPPCDVAPVVVFSAAVPHQGGNRHINEQWQSYWMELIAARGDEAFDSVRPLVYGNSSGDWWYC